MGRTKKKQNLVFSIFKFLREIISDVGGLLLFPFREIYIFLKPKRRRGRPTKPFGRFVKKLKPFIKHSSLVMFLVGFFGAIFFVMVPYELSVWFRDLPKTDLIVSETSRRSTRIFDRNGKLLYEIYVDRKYDPVELEQIPEVVKEATLAVEDEGFYSHGGFRVVSMGKAAYEAAFEGKQVRGGSTITQQLIKNVLLTPERTVSRKLKEIVLAVFVEARYTKDEIFELYLNNISYGGTAWGIQSAAQKYFGKNVWELSLAETSMLAGLPSAPSVYSPLVDLSLAKERQKHVLNRMYDLGYITKKELLLAYEEELYFAEQGEFIKAPHFVHFVRHELEKMYGKRMVEYGGLNVTTTLDLDLQGKVEGIVEEEVNANRWLNLSNGAAVVLDTQYAGILAHVGSVDYYQEGWGAYDVATAYRQPGSSIKPVTYALALEKGFTPATVIKDSPVTFQIAGSRPYSPVNYDGRYHGDVSLRGALANSYNIPAVRLAQVLGPDNIVSLGRDMGLVNWEVDGSYGLAVTLGGKEVRLVDITNTFATFGREGSYKELSPFLSIKDSNGYEVYDEESRVEGEALSKEVSYLMWHILSDNNARTPAFGPSSSLVIPGYRVAVKTGTTDEKRDNWTVGFTPTHAFGVWVGNNDNTPMNPGVTSGLTGASPIWNKVVKATLEGEPNVEMEKPEGVFVKYDSKCGRSEVFLKGSNVPETLCPKDKDDDKDKDKDKDKDRDD
jgi:penicillin-binding protein 1C